MSDVQKSKGRLLYVINHMDWFWSHRLPLALGAQEAGWDVSVVAPLRAEDRPKLAKHLFCAKNIPDRTEWLPLFAMRTIWALRGILRGSDAQDCGQNYERGQDENGPQFAPSCVHAITLFYVFLTGLAVMLSGRRNLKCVYTIAGLGYLFSANGFKPALLRALICPLLGLILKRKGVQVIVQNPDDLKILTRLKLVDPARAHLIKGSGVDLTDFYPRPDVAPSDPPIVLMPTRLLHDKGVAVFARAAEILKARGVVAQFQIAGGLSASNPMAMTQADMDALTASGAVQWLGRVSDMPALLAKASLIAYPSYYREGVPKVLLEACALAKPIITTDHPGCREAVTDGVNGVLVPVKDVDKLAEAIATLLAEPARLQTMGAESLKRAQQAFDVKLIVGQTLQVYNAL